MYLKNLFLIFFSALGISATFMPWMHYPKGNGIIYGYLGDGIVTGFVFFLILLYALITLRKRLLHSIFSFIIAGLGFLMALLSYSKIQEIEAEKLNFKTENPMIAIATAGFHEGIGIYIFGIAGLGVFLTIIAAFLYKFFNSKSNDADNFSENNSIILKYTGYLIIIAMIAVSMIFLLENKNNAVSKESIRNEIKDQVSIMGKALTKGDYNTFVAYNHPVMIQSYGGKEKTISLLRSTLDELKKSGRSIQDVSLAEIYDMTHDGKKIQAIITMKVIYSGTENEKTEIQKMIAVSDDGGANWHFINIDGKTKAEMLKFFPDLNPNLKF